MKPSRAVAQVLALICLIELTLAVRELNDLRVKTSAYGLQRSQAFFQIPTLSSSPLFRHYVKVAPEPGFKFKMNFFCPQDDTTLCFMYDRKGNVAGAQISVMKEDVADIKREHYDYEGNQNYIKTNFANKEAYSIRVYFTNPEELDGGGRDDPHEIADGLWTYLDGKLVEIKKDEPTEIKMGDFDRQGCYPAMGQHYFYKYNKNSICKNLFAFFPLYEKGGLVGFGVAVPGKGAKNSHKEWFEDPTPEVMKVVVQNPTQCDEIGKKYGYRTMHVFLVDRPWEISCP